MLGDRPPVKVFYYYSSRDKSLGRELSRQLGIFEQNAKISIWNNEKLLGGDVTDDVITSEIHSSDIILLLISSTFLNSDIWGLIARNIRLKMARKFNSTRIIPIIFRPCSWNEVDLLKRFQALPRHPESEVLAITLWANQDQAFAQISQKVGLIAESVFNERLKIKQQNIAVYENAFYKALERERPLRLETQRKLNRLQEILGLTNSEISFSESLIHAKIVDDSANQEKYRLEVRANIQEDRGEISPMSRILLDREREVLGLTPEVAKAIENEELKYPQKYERVFFAIYSMEYYLGESAKYRLTMIAKKLGLAQSGLFEEIQNRIVERLRISREDAMLILRSRMIPKDILENHGQNIIESEISVDYSKLRLALEAKRWEIADRETWMIFRSFAEKTGWNWRIPSNKLLDFPSLDLRTINTLWQTYSNHRFGFSSQIQVYQECGGLLNGNFESELWEKFGKRVGWANERYWLYCFELNFSLEAPKGHLPGKIFSSVTGPLLLQIAHIANLEFAD